MILDDLANAARRRVIASRESIPFEKVKEKALGMECDTGFPFEKALSGPDISFICEVKKASPSKGIIAEEFPYMEIAREYERAGAAAISVLTETDYFLGSPQYLKEIAAEVKIPVLRKDFTVDEYQIYEKYMEICDQLGLSALVEVHDEEEMKTAIAAGARLIGVNNRNLKNFTVDIHNSMRLRKLAPENTIFVAESGIRTASDIQNLRDGKVNAVLIGETLMRSPDKKKMLDELRGY